MSGASSSAAGWSSLLEPASPPRDLPRRADDPRLGEVIEFWRGDVEALRPGRPVLLGFPQDEGIRRNFGRPGTAEGPHAIRHWLQRLTTWDPDTGTDLAASPPLDLGNVRIVGRMEDTQEALAKVLSAVLRSGAVPIVLGGGHETAYGTYLGQVQAGRRVGLINIDAHLDVRPLIEGQGHCGSPFRQALEHPTAPLAGKHYVCLGIQPHATSRQHWQYARDRGCVVRWCNELHPSLAEHLRQECDRLAAEGCQVHLSIDADVVQLADVPAVSAPNPVGLSGREVIQAARLASQLPQVSGMELVEIAPCLDRDGQSARWAALVVWNFLVGVVSRK